jgi:hypothetical protein
MAKKYKYDDCTYCGGRVTERGIQKPCFWGDKLIALVDRKVFDFSIMKSTATK